MVVDLIASKIASILPNIAYAVDKPTPGTTVKACQRGLLNYHGRGFGGSTLISDGGHSWLTMGEWRSKALSVVKPHEELEPVEADHRLYRLFHNPNPVDTAFDIAYELQMFEELCGVSYEWLVPNEWGIPSERWVIPSHWVWPRTGGGRYVNPEHQHADELIQYYEVRPWGGLGSAGMLRIPPNEIIMSRWKSPINKIDGYSKLSAIAQWIDSEESISASRWSQFQNQARPEFWVELGPGYEDPNDDRIARIEAKFAAKIQGEYNYGKPVITPPGAKITPLSFSPTEMAYFDSHEQIQDMIFSAFRVPPAAVGKAKDLTYGSILATLSALCTYCLNPRLALRGQVYTKHLASRWKEKNRSIRIWFDDCVPADPSQINADIETDLHSYAISPNEVRALRGRKPWKHGGDDPMAQGPGGIMPLPLNTGEDLSVFAELIRPLEENQQPQMPGLPGLPGAAGQQETPSDQDQRFQDDFAERAEGAGIGIENPNSDPDLGGKGDGNEVTKGAFYRPGLLADLAYAIGSGRVALATEEELMRRFGAQSMRDLSSKIRGASDRQLQEVAELVASRQPGVLPVGWDDYKKALDGQGGERPAVETDALQQADFVTLPESIEGTNCSSCEYNEDGVCQHKSLAGQPVTERNCCAYWSAPGTLRTWQEKHGARSKRWRFPDYVAKKAGPFKFSSTQFDLPDELAERVLDLIDRIDDADLAEDGKEDTPHVTVKYGLHTSDPEDVRRLVAGLGPLTLWLGKPSLFTTDDTGKDYEVLKLEVRSNDLVRLNQRLAEALDHTDTHPEYQPHLTLAYLQPGSGAKYLDWDDFAGEEVTLDTLTFSDAAGNATALPLGVAGDGPGSEVAFASRDLPPRDPERLLDVPDIRQADHFSCILPGQELQGLVVGASKARYAGEAVEIRTAGGAVLSVTANHPVLTMMGFVAAGDLKEGDHLLHYVGENEATASCDHKQYAPAAVEDAFGAFLNISGTVLAPEKVRCAPFDFHGDAQGFQGEVEVVGSYGQLGRNFVADSTEGFAQRSLVRSNLRLVSESCCGGFEFGFVGAGPPSAGLMGGKRLCDPGVFVHSLPDQSAGLVPASDEDTVFTKSVGEEFFAESSLAADGFERFPVFVAADQLVQIGDVGSDACPLFGRGQRLVTVNSEAGIKSLATDPDGSGDFADRHAVQMPLYKLSDVRYGKAAFLSHDSIGFGPASQLDVEAKEPSLDGQSASVVLALKLAERCPGEIVLDDVIAIKKFHYEGPVYDFESPYGFVVVNRLCISNCGAAASMSVGKFFGVGPDTLEEWKAALGTSEKESTSPLEIVRYLSELGLEVTIQYGMSVADLREAWRAGKPVICPIQEYGVPDKQASYDYGHYVTVVGVSLGHVFVGDPSIDNVLGIPGGTVGDQPDPDVLQTFGRSMIKEELWETVWHDEDADGNTYDHFGILVGPPVAEEIRKGFPTIQDAGRFLARRWEQLEARYGRKPALAMAAAMLATAPLPGNIAAVIAAAEAIRGVHGYLTTPAKPEKPAELPPAGNGESYFGSCDRDPQGHCKDEPPPRPSRPVNRLAKLLSKPAAPMPAAVAQAEKELEILTPILSPELWETVRGLYASSEPVT